MCPYCTCQTQLVGNGAYQRKSDQKVVRRFICRNCGKGFSEQTSSFDFRLRKRRVNQGVFRLLSKGMSQRGIAEVMGINRKSVARRITRYGACAREHLKLSQKTQEKVSDVVLDELESFEHTKLKPVTIGLAVENKTRRILSVKVGRIAAKGHLATLSRKKYGHRTCERKLILK